MNTATKQTKRATNIFGAIGVVSNVAGAVGLLYGRLEVLVIVIAVIALASGAYLVVRRWGMPLGYITLFAIIIMLAGTATLSVVLDRRGLLPHSSASSGQTSAAGGGGSALGGSSGGTAITASHKLIYNDQITFKAGTGRDFENHGAVLNGNASQASPADLYIDLNDFLRAPSGDIFSFYDTGTDDPATCTQLLAAGKDPASVQLTDGSVRYQDYCFLTSKDNIGQIKIDTTSILGHTAQDYITATIYVWAK